MKTINNILKVIAISIGLATLSGCVNEDEYPDTPQGNFEALWKLIDEHYCFFDYKQHAYGLDWQQAYNKYNTLTYTLLSTTADTGNGMRTTQLTSAIRCSADISAQTIASPQP